MVDVKTDKSVLCDHVDLDNLIILDVGCGAGEMVHFMSVVGARVIGLECNDAQLIMAESGHLNENEEYCRGVGQDLPFDDCTFDLVTFFNSLHHIPAEFMADSLKEAARVVKPNGVIYVAEPIARGSGFEVHAPIDDETVVRNLALEAIYSLDEHGLILSDEILYDTVYHYADFDAFEEELIRIDPTRRARFDTLRDELHEAFIRLGRVDEFGFRFDQPMRLNLLKKPA